MDVNGERPVAIVTGAATGIGRATSIRLCRDGYIVWAVGLGDEALQETARVASGEGGVCTARTFDVTDQTVREALFADIAGQHGRLDLLVNNAAIVGGAALASAAEQTLAFVEKVLSVNLVAAFAFAQLARPLMVQSGGGVIVNVSSVAADAAQENASAYCMSKAGMNAMTRSLAIEWAAEGIRVVGVAPGDIDTETSRNVNKDRKAGGGTGRFTRVTPRERRGHPDEIAAVIAFLASKEATFVTGETVRADGGFLSY